MPQITNAQLHDEIAKLELRAAQLEMRMNHNESAIDSMKETLETLDKTMHAARTGLGIIGAVVGPVITGVIVLIIEHLLGK